VDRSLLPPDGHTEGGTGLGLDREQILGLGRLSAAVLIAGALLEADEETADSPGFVPDRPLSLDLASDVPDL
jgi:hypothetical protein